MAESGAESSNVVAKTEVQATKNRWRFLKDVPKKAIDKISNSQGVDKVRGGIRSGIDIAKSIIPPDQPPSWEEQRQKLKRELNPHKYNLKDKDPFDLVPGMARSDPIADLILGYANSGNRDVANSLNQIYAPMMELLKSYDLEDSIKTRIESLLLRGNKPVIYRLAVELAERQGVLAKSLPEKSHDRRRSAELSAFGFDVALQFDREWNLQQETFGPPRIKQIKEGGWKDFVERRLQSKEFDFKPPKPPQPQK